MQHQNFVVAELFLKPDFKKSEQLRFSGTLDTFKDLKMLSIIMRCEIILDFDVTATLTAFFWANLIEIFSKKWASKASFVR